MAEKTKKPRKTRKSKKRGGLKGFTQKSGDMRPTKSGAGMTKKGVAKYRRQNPGSKLKTAVTEKSPSKARYLSSCVVSLRLFISFKTRFLFLFL